MSKRVLENIAKKYENVREGVGKIMGGRVLEFEGKSIYKDGMEAGMEAGTKLMAVRFYKMGFSLESIAKAAEVSVELVQKWIPETVEEPVAG